MAFSFNLSEPLRALSRYALVRSKVERAKQGLVDMERRLDEFYGNTPGVNRYIKPRFSQSGEQIEYHIPMDSLAAAGDVVSNLRGALDHLADAYTPNCPDTVLEKTCFPIGKDMASYKSLRRRIEKVIHPEAVKLIDSMKPYKNGNEPLFLLNDLNNISKHRMLLTVAETVYCHADWISNISLATTFQYKIKNPHFWGIYGYPSVHGYVQSSIEESLGKPQVFGGDALLPPLHYLVEFVEPLIMGFLPYLAHVRLSAA